MHGLGDTAEARFLGVLARADARLAAVWWSLVLLRGVLPALFAVAMGALVGAVESGAALGLPLAAAGIVFLAISALQPLHGTVGSLLGAKGGAWLHDRLMEACVEPAGLAHLERPDLADELAAARDFDLGVAAPPLETAVPEIGHGFATVVSGLAQALLLAAYEWWAALLVGGAWAATHVLLRESAMWKIWSVDGVVTEQRHVNYAYRLAVDAPAAKEIRVFGLADWVVSWFATRRRRLAEFLYHERRLRQRPLGWSLALIVIANALVFWALARDATAGAIGLAQLVMFAQAAVGTAALAFGDFDWWFRSSAQPIPKVLDLARQMRPAGRIEEGRKSTGGQPRDALRFRAVRFAYPTTDEPVLDGFDLSIPAGRSLAIVGPNGAGKTTIAKLICRLYDPQAGEILVDGTDLREYALGPWRSRVAAVFQDFIHFEWPLRDNVAPAGAPDDVIMRALERAGAADIASLDTILSRAYQGGAELSGGQWQRIALARTLCAVQQGAGLVILDEPTAQLDVRGEAEIFDRILEATRGLTTILISHRFSTVRHADRICVLEGGRIVEEGTHAELMSLGRRYHTMFELQASRFSDDGDAYDA
ncbi:MAG: ABC transporter ATP-binding protein [Longimicrobiales bacterium]